MPLHLTPLPTVLYRVGKLPEPFTWRLPLQNLEPSDEPDLSGGRWDAAEREFPTLYCADSPFVAFVEVIQDYRPVEDYDDESWLARFEEDSGFEPDPPAQSGVLPKEFFEPSPSLDPESDAYARGRALGVASASEGMLIDISHSDTHHELNLAVRDVIESLGFDRFDRGVVMSQDRRITRPLASYLYSVARSQAVGIQFESRLVPGLCFALWESTPISPGDLTPVTTANKDLQRATKALHIKMPDALVV